ncbi:hypothetical protein ACFWGD_02375 [Corynebacterium sp. NPDC060344]|uniref:hypothetical protein n=1 Tax=Corynebacterium sp. NPDC060344 TaxID=3347101 RepID=UPI00364C72AC
MPGSPSRPESRTPSRSTPRTPSRSTPRSAALLARSDLPRAAKGAIAAAQALGPAALVALVAGIVAVFLGWPLVAWTAVIVMLAWCVCWGVFAGVAAGKWALLAAIASAAPGAWALAAGLTGTTAPGLPAMIGALLLGLAAGLVGGVAVRASWDRRQADRDRRLAALPDWARDELGDAADRLDPDFRRDPGPAIASNHSDPAVRLLAAVCRPLPGSTILAGEPAVAVNGSRVAVVAWGPRLDRADAAPPLPPLPEGATARVFVLREGTELESLDDDPAREFGGDTEGIDIIATEPQELAAHLGAGTPPDGDACHGIAADLHARVLDALDGYPGSGERQISRPR